MVTKKERELLNLAKEIISLNPHLNVMLSGSLLLAHLGIKKRREARDIDIVCWVLNDNTLLPIMPKNFKLDLMDGDKSDLKAIRYFNEKGVKVEFMASQEKKDEGEMVDGIPCASHTILLDTKIKYAVNDISYYSATKNILDIVYLLKHNDIFKDYVSDAALNILYNTCKFRKYKKDTLLMRFKLYFCNFWWEFSYNLKSKKY